MGWTQLGGEGREHLGRHHAVVLQKQGYAYNSARISEVTQQSLFGQVLQAFAFTCFTLDVSFLTEHYSDDLGMELEDSMEQDFNMKLEDGSPYEVSGTHQ